MPFLDPDEVFPETSPPTVKNGAYPMAAVLATAAQRQLALTYGGAQFYTMSLETEYRAVSGGGETTTAHRSVDVWVPSFTNLIGFKVVGAGSGNVLIEYGSVDYNVSAGGGDAEGSLAVKKKMLSVSSGAMAPTEMIPFTAADTPQVLELTLTPGTGVYIEQLIVIFSKVAGTI